MGNFARWVRELAGSDGGVATAVGLFAVACFDSSLLSLPEVNDLLLVYVSIRSHDYALFYALAMVLGSATGCTGLYWLARSRGHAYLARKYPKGRVQRIFKVFERYGALAVFVPAILPPPMPFKIFVLSAGIFGLTYTRFIVAIVFGRSIRYFGTAYLAVRFGERALDYLRVNYVPVLAMVLAGAIAGVALALVWRRRRGEQRSFEGQ